MGVPRISTGPMTVDEFYAFTDRRPDEEKWELIDGEPVLNASPSRLHQRILQNLLLALGNRSQGRSWEVLPGLGVRISETQRPEPDLLILPLGSENSLAQRESNDAIVAFEILSPTTADRDLRWKRTAYTSLASLTHYVILAQDAVDVVVIARGDGFAERRLRSLNDLVDFQELGVSLPLSEIYRNTGLR
jgi:Uma2 family endonuclease